jgi:pimeloyl-ACP methyl ester carboxylesterase
MKAKVRSIVLWLLAVLSLPILVSCSSSEPPMLSRFEETTCKHTLEAGSTTRCGYLTVPEDRNNPDNGKTLKLYVAIYKALDGSTTNVPLIYLTGGPGASTASAYSIFEMSNFYIRQNFGDIRDIVVLDQRGTNYSNPSLYCSQELGPLRSQVYGLSFKDAAAKRIQGFVACYSRLQAEGVNLSAYDSLENATDVRDMSLILGYSQFNIYSASYGTRLALLTMKHYPQRILSVTLDSILPPEVNPFERAPAGNVHAFRTFFDAASVKYPLIETHFYTMMNALEAAPVDVVGHHYNSAGNPTDNIAIRVTGDKVASYLISKLKETPYDTKLPQRIETMYATNDYGPIADSWIGFLDFFFPTGEAGTDSPSVAMYNSVFSADDAYYTSAAKIMQNIKQSFPNAQDAPIAAWHEHNFIDMEPAVLGLWPVEPLPFEESSQVVSSVPTLMLVGTLDTATPETFISQPTTDYLSRSFYFPILAGHATAYLECVDRMMNGFVKNPGVRPTNSCAAAYTWD